MLVEGEEDARPMGKGNGPKPPSYNIQTAVDADTGLIIHHEVTDEVTDNRQLHPMAKATRDVLGRVEGYQTARASPPREGAALLQGRVVCGRCGCHMSARYAARRGQVDTWYICHRAYASRGEPHCQSIAGWPVDEAVGELIAVKMTPRRRGVGAGDQKRDRSSS